MIDATQYEHDPRYAEIRELVAIATSARESDDNEVDDEADYQSSSSEDANSARTRKLSPMKPATRRKQR